MNLTGIVYRPPYEADSLLTREQLHPHLNEFPKRGGEGSILNR